MRRFVSVSIQEIILINTLFMVRKLGNKKVSTISCLKYIRHIFTSKDSILIDKTGTKKIKSVLWDNLLSIFSSTVTFSVILGCVFLPGGWYGSWNS